MGLRKYIILFISTLYLGSVSAQTFSVSAAVDSTILLVGEQAKLTFEVIQTKGQHIQFPLLSDTIVSGLEIVDRLPMDTQVIGNNQMRVSQSYVITSFDSALYFIEQQPFVNNTDTQFSSSCSLKVISIPVDTTQHAIADIKPNYSPPFNWPLFWRILVGVLVGAGLIALAIYLYLKYRKQKHVVEADKQEYDSRSAYEIAIDRLSAIKNEKLWQQNRPKEFYTQLSDVLRDYISRRFNINASEQTSGDVLNAIYPELKKKKESFVLLQHVFQLSDLAKFAKYQPLIEENEKSLAQAFQFVEDTKEEVVERTMVEETNDKASI